MNIDRDYRTEPLESVRNVFTGTVTVELRGTVDRAARKAA
jgi:hypothetical protein